MTTEITKSADAVLKFQRGEFGIEEMLKRCHRTLKMVSVYTADKYQRRHIAGDREAMADDLFQDLQYWLWQKIAAEFDPEIGALESLLLKYARNIALNNYTPKELILAAKSGESFNEDMFDRGENARGDSFVSDMRDFDDMEQQIDKEIALQQILPLLSLYDNKSPPPSKSTGNRGGKHECGPQYTLTKDQQELRDIMKDLRLKQPEMANALGIPHARFSSYIYGRTDSVPHEVMKNARGLRESGSLAVTKAQTLFDGKTMSQIMDRWQECLSWNTLSIEERDKRLAEFFVVATVTPRRWRNGKNRPDDATLVRYQFLVDDFVQRRKQA